jgi:hypothetical protein
VTDQIVTVVGTLLGVVVGLFGERWVRTWGKVRCDILWRPSMSSGSVDSPGGVEVLERRLEATFLNRKDVPVTVWEMRMVFYRRDKPLGEEERPHMEFVVRDRRGPFELVNLPPRVPVTQSVCVLPGHNDFDRHRAVKEADRVEFVAVIEGAKTISTSLALWNDLTPQTKRY